MRAMNSGSIMSNLSPMASKAFASALGTRAETDRRGLFGFPRRFDRVRGDFFFEAMISSNCRCDLFPTGRSADPPIPLPFSNRLQNYTLEGSPFPRHSPFSWA